MRHIRSTRKASISDQPHGWLVERICKFGANQAFQLAEILVSIQILLLKQQGELQATRLIPRSISLHAAAVNSSI
jgi:hypothetical protein